jgi:hypothetical protein
MMKRTKTIKINDKEIICAELSAGEVQEIMDGLETIKTGIVDLLFPDRIPSSTIKKSTGMGDEELNKYSPSEMEIIIDAVEEVNPTFASLLQRLAAVGRNYLEMKSDTPAVD